MSLDAKLRARLERILRVVDDYGTTGPRLVQDARRLWSRIGTFVAMGLLPDEPRRDELEALELASYALQLPERRSRTLPTGKPGRSTLRDRAEEAAELLVGLAAADTDDALLDRTTRILQEMPHRSPMLDEARLLADALNLDDFGMTGIARQAMHHARHGEGLNKLAYWLDRQEQYGYWEARLKDGFHFDAVRQIAKKRLENARKAAAMLRGEMEEDGA
jgi:hypothetical protein